MDIKTPNERLKIARKELGLTLEKFGNRIGVTKTAISLIESGKNALTEKNAILICKEFGIDYLWLTTGEGEPFPKNDDEDIMTQLEIIMAGESDAHKNLIKSLVNCSEEELEAIEKFIDVIKRS